MKIYDESGRLLTGEPDLTRGWLGTQQRLKAHEPARPAQAEQSHLEVMAGTDGLRRKVVDVPFLPAVPARDEYELVRVYHPYTEQELEQLSRPGQEERLCAVENALLELMLTGGEGGV